MMQVIPGLDEGMKTMKVGGIRRLYIPGTHAKLSLDGPVISTPLSRSEGLLRDHAVRERSCYQQDQLLISRIFDVAEWRCWSCCIC